MNDNFKLGEAIQYLEEKGIRFDAIWVLSASGPTNGMLHRKFEVTLGKEFPMKNEFVIASICIPNKENLLALLQWFGILGLGVREHIEKSFADGAKNLMLNISYYGDWHKN